MHSTSHIPVKTTSRCKTDVVSCRLCGFPPFDETTGYDLEFPSPEWDNVSESAKDLIQKLLVVDPAKRLSANQALSHLWVSGAGAGNQSIAGMYLCMAHMQVIVVVDKFLLHRRAINNEGVQFLQERWHCI